VEPIASTVDFLKLDASREAVGGRALLLGENDASGLPAGCRTARADLWQPLFLSCYGFSVAYLRCFLQAATMSRSVSFACS
jgi:hypothetical protein